MFLITTLPTCLAGVLFAFFCRRNSTFDGLSAVILLIALIAAARVFFDATPLLAATDHMTSRAYFLKPNPSYSTVSYGALFLLGALFATARHWTWPLAALFLFLTLWLDRKTETVLIIFALCAVAAFRTYLSGRWRHESGKLVSLGVITFALWLPLHNESNELTWHNLYSNAAQRVAIITNQEWDVNKGHLVEHPKRIEVAAASPTTSTPSAAPIVTDQPTGPEIDSTPEIGLGSFALNSVNKDVRWPHNILVETYLEIGALSPAAIVLIVFVGLIISARRAIAFHDSRYLLLALALLSMFTLSLKSGDITNVGRIVFFALVATGQLGMRPPDVDQHSSSTAS